MKRLLLCLFFAFGCVLNAQYLGTVHTLPDCQFPFYFTAAGNTGNFSNATTGCQTWYIVYASNGFSALSLTVQSAPDAGNTPGTWVTFAGTVTTGVNPNTSTTQATAQLAGYYPWVRVVLSGTTGTGSIAGVLYGWRGSATPGGGSGGGGGGTVQSCGSQAKFNLTSSGNTKIITASGSLTTYICSISFSVSGTTGVDWKWTQGTGSNCGTGTADVTGLYGNTVAASLDYNAQSPLVIGASQDACINLGSNVTLGGVVIYSQR